MASPNPPSIRWSVGPSIAMELDLALTAASGYFIPSSLPEEYTSFILNLPADWQAELPVYLDKDPSFSSLLEIAAYLAGALQETDYSNGTLAIRELTLPQAFDRITRFAKPGEDQFNAAQPTPEQFIELTSTVFSDTYILSGFSPSEITARKVEIASQLKKVLRILQGGDLYARFWHWLDRFYYQFYRPWRSMREQAVDLEIRQATTALGGMQGGGVPDFGWLSEQNPLKRIPPLRKAVEEFDLPIFFWAEPFGMMDAWGLYPDLLAVSFARPGIIFENFRTTAQDVANRVAALADPTRLMILRMIRQFSMDNTEIAAYLGIARPTVSIHAKILREAGLIRSYPVGRSTRHEIDPDKVRLVFNDLRRLLDLPKPESED